MSLALFRKTLRDSWLLLTISALGIAIFEILMIQAFHYTVKNPSMYFMRNIPDVAARFVNILAGADVRRLITPTGLMSIGFAHPVVQILVWAFTTSFTTRVMVGEIDRGTADLLLTLPISRPRIYMTVTWVWIFAGIVLCSAPVLGTIYAQEHYGRGPFDMPRLIKVSTNLLALYLAGGGVGMMISALTSRRGQAIGLIVGFLVASFVANFLSAIWETAKPLAKFGIFEYFKPLPTIDTGNWPTRDLTILGFAAFAAWLVGLIVFTRRDIRA